MPAVLLCGSGVESALGVNRGARTKLNRRETLATAATAENPAASRIATVGPAPAAGSGKAEDQRDECRADRLPEQSGGRLDRAGAAAALARRAATMARLFGDWKNPNPNPHNVIRQMMSAVPG